MRPDSPRVAAVSAKEQGRRGRLRWRCMRRGLLELDIVFERFLGSDFDALDEPQLEALDQLLDYEDNELWAILSGREDCPDSRLAALCEKLRGAQALRGADR